MNFRSWWELIWPHRQWNLSEHAFTIEEYLVREFETGKFDSSMFTRETVQLKLHGHCQQKAIASTAPSLKLLSIPENYRVTEIPSGCCGMAGSFGYEKEHYDLSMKVGELVLFPAIREAGKDELDCCTRHQLQAPDQ